MIRLSVIGTGWIAAAFIKAALATKKFEIVAIYSRTKEKGEKFAKENSCKRVFTKLEEMAKCEDIDAVYIASPNFLHAEQSELFLKNKKHVICEKPATSLPNEAKRLIQIAKEEDVIYMEAIMSLYVSQFEKLKAAIEKIGVIRQAKFDYCQLSSKYKALKNGENPNIFNPKIKAGAAMDIGIYCVYPALALFSMPKEVKAIANILEVSDGKGELGKIDLCGGALLYYKDKQISLTYSKVGDSRGVSEIIGDKGTITVKGVAALREINLYDTEGNLTVIHKDSEDTLSMQGEAEQFYNYITNFKDNSEKYEQAGNLIVMVSEVLQKIRKESGVSF